ncbi:hypothetical protein C6A85_02450, partial [Mycobacterium sp. ITM-2017-0098]
PPVGGVVIHVIARHDTLDTTNQPSDSEGPRGEADGSTDVEGSGDAEDADRPCDSEGPRDSGDGAESGAAA